MKDKKYDVVKTEKAELGRFVIQLDMVKEEGAVYPYSFIKMRNSVAVLAEYEGMFILIRQYRHSIDEYVLEIPGGALEEEEDPEESAKRELLEETGFIAQSIVSLGTFYPTVGVSDECCYLYYTKCNDRIKQRLEPLEYLDVELIHPSDLEKMIREGIFLHSMGLVAWLKYKMMDGGRGLC